MRSSPPAAAAVTDPVPKLAAIQPIGTQSNAVEHGNGVHQHAPMKRKSIGFTERQRSSKLVGQRSMTLMMKQTDAGGNRFVLFVIRMFRRWGYFIVNYDWQAMLICTLISLFGLYYVLNTPQRNDITGYAPYNARARTEYRRFQEFFAHDGVGVSVYIYIVAKDGGSMLREQYLNETIEILNIANDDVLMQQHSPNESRLGFAQFCQSFCKINEPVRAFYNGLRVQNELMRQGEGLNERISLNYPVAHFFGRSITLQQAFYGLEFYNATVDQQLEQFNLTSALLQADVKFALNSTEPAEDIFAVKKDGVGAVYARHVTNMREVKLVVLQFQAEHQPGWDSELVKEYELSMVYRFQSQYQSKRLQLNVLSKSYVEEEMVRAGMSILPYMTVGFLVMCICTVCSVVIRAIYMHQHSSPKILLAIAACILPFMSAATALGSMFLFGTRFASILCLVPFLALSIGVDSSYLMIHEWQRVIKHFRNQPNQNKCNVGYRISEVLSEVGPAILISTLTNVFADGMGAYTSSPELASLCLANMISMIIAFFYQMTFYAGLISLVGRYELVKETRERGEQQEHIISRQAGNGGTVEFKMANGNLMHTKKQRQIHEHTKYYISGILANKLVALFIVSLYLLYLAISIIGICRMEINLTAQKLFSRDSPLVMLDTLRVKYQVPHFMVSTVLVFQPGNLSNPERLARMNEFVAEMEAINGSWGPVGTYYFVRDFIPFESTFNGETETEPEAAELEIGETDEKRQSDKDLHGTMATTTTQTLNGPFHEEDLSAFVRWPEYIQWAGFIKLDNQTGRLNRFFFTGGYHGPQLAEWTERGHLLLQWRKVVDKYSDPDGFDASVYLEDAVFLDLVFNMSSDTLQSVLGTLGCMAVVCFLFLNSLFTVLMASGCVLSICCGILGILSWWNIDLDPITMAAMTISIGFSVDIPAHVSYHYYQASDATPKLKLVNCLSSVAFPALQAALSTTLCICSLLFVDLYMADVFVKTMVLCVLLCNLHGLVFLPAFLILFDTFVQNCRAKFCRKACSDLTTKQCERKEAQIPVVEKCSIREVEREKEKHQNGYSQAHQHQDHHWRMKNGRGTSPAEQSRVTDRPKLELNNIIVEPKGIKLKQKQQQLEMNP